MKAELRFRPLIETPIFDDDAASLDKLANSIEPRELMLLNSVKFMRPTGIRRGFAERLSIASR